MPKPLRIPVRVAFAAIALSAAAWIGCGKDALYETSKDPRLVSDRTAAGTPGPNRIEQNNSYEYDGSGRLAKISQTRTSYSGFNIRDNLAGQVSSLWITEYGYDGGRVVSTTLRRWASQDGSCPVADASCFEVISTREYTDFESGLPATTLDKDGSGRLTARCGNRYDLNGRLSERNCALYSGSAGLDSLVQVETWFYDAFGNARTYAVQGNGATFSRTTLAAYDPVIRNPYSLTGLPHYANVVSRNVEIERDGIPSWYTPISENELLRGLTRDGQIEAIYRYE